MRIIIHLSQEEPLNPDEPLADIELLGDAGDAILDSDGWADDWLMALVQGVEALGRGETHKTAEIITEPHPLIFSSSGEGFTVTYNQSKITVNSLRQFRQELKRAIKRVIEEFGPGQVFSPESFWKRLEEYAGG